MRATRAFAVAGSLVAAACASSGKTEPEKTGTISAGTCDCCGHLVDVAGGQRCDDPRVCAGACADGSAPVDAGGDGG